MSKILSNIVFQIDPKLEKAKIAASTASKTLDGVSVSSSDDGSLNSSPKLQSLDNLWIGAAILDQMAANSSVEQGDSAARSLRLQQDKDSKDVEITRSAKMVL